MTIEMRLEPDIFDAVLSGRKTIETRIYDLKRRTIQLGDEIIFKKRPDCVVRCKAKIIGLLRYATFDQMLDDVSSTLLGISEENRAAEKQSLRKFYSVEEELLYGVVGIRFEVNHA